MTPAVSPQQRGLVQVQSSAGMDWESQRICCTLTSHQAAGAGAGDAYAGDAVPPDGVAQGRSFAVPGVLGNILEARCSSFAPRWDLENNSAVPDQMRPLPDVARAEAPQS